MTICKNGLQHRNSFELDYGSRAILLVSISIEFSAGYNDFDLRCSIARY